MPPLLKGLRVLDLTRNLPGPFATRMLADLGAEIIKVEPPEGDPARALGSLFEALNHGKDCRKLDFKTEDGRATLREWAREADVVLDSFRPGVLDAMGLGHAALRVVQPKIVLCSITGYGQTGEWAQRAGHDLNFMAMSGALDQMRARNGDVAMSNIQWGDLAGGSSMACIAVLAAVFAGAKPRGGYTIKVRRIVQTERDVIVYVTEQAPSSGQAGTAQITYPYQIVSLPRTSLPLRFSFDTRSS